MYDKIGIQQGWQCPLCKRIYAPFVTECFYCPRSNITYTTLMEEPISPSKSTTAVNNHISDSAWISRITEGEN